MSGFNYPVGQPAASVSVALTANIGATTIVNVFPNESAVIYRIHVDMEMTSLDAGATFNAVRVIFTETVSGNAIWRASLDPDAPSDHIEFERGFKLFQGGDLQYAVQLLTAPQGGRLNMQVWYTPVTTS